ncbi:MAG: LytR/AlgR family response regulator transcription factor [Syntrophothermus sp.]
MNKKILIIEDDKAVRSNIQQLLYESGYEVQTAGDGISGIQQALSFQPDVIVCDIMMPGIDGLEVLKELQRHPEAASIPFIFLTAKAELSDIRLGLKSGADDYLVKPFSAAELLNAIELRLHKRMMILRNEKEKSQTESGQSKQALDYNSNLFLQMGDRPEIIKVNKIKYIQAESEYSNIITADEKKLLVRRLLKEWEEMLPSRHFLRIHRSTIINIEYIKKIEKWFNHSFRVHMDAVPEPFIVSRRYSTKLRSQNNFT